MMASHDKFTLRRSKEGSEMMNVFKTPEIAGVAGNVMRPNAAALVVTKPFARLLASITIAASLATGCEAATLGGAMQRLVGAVTAESTPLLGLLAICVVLGLVLAVDRRRRVRMPQSNT